MAREIAAGTPLGLTTRSAQAEGAGFSSLPQRYLLAARRHQASSSMAMSICSSQRVRAADKRAWFVGVEPDNAMAANRRCPMAWREAMQRPVRLMPTIGHSPNTGRSDSGSSAAQPTIVVTHILPVPISDLECTDLA